MLEEFEIQRPIPLDHTASIFLYHEGVFEGSRLLNIDWLYISSPQAQGPLSSFITYIERILCDKRSK